MVDFKKMQKNVSLHRRFKQLFYDSQCSTKLAQKGGGGGGMKPQIDGRASDGLL